MVDVDFQEVLKRAMKYFIEGLAVAVAVVVIPSRKLKTEEVLMVATSGAATMAVLDTFVPDVAAGARFGAGFGIGSKGVGFK